MPSYSKTLRSPIWAVYEGKKLIATVRATRRGMAAEKLAEWLTEGRELKYIGEWTPQEEKEQR